MGSHTVSQAFIQFMQGKGLNINQIVDRVISHGWFVPGMYFLLFPVQTLAGGKASIFFVRLYVLMINLGLLFWIAIYLKKMKVRSFQIFLFLLAVGLFPYYRLFLSGLWGDLIGVHLVIIASLHLEYRLCIGAEKKLTWFSALSLGAILALSMMIRPQFVFFPLVLILRLLLYYLNHSREESLRCLLKKFSLRVVCMLLVPTFVLVVWHSLLYKKFGPTFMVTSPLLSRLVFDKEYSAMARKKGKNKIERKNSWHAVQAYVVEKSTKNGITFAAQAKIERDSLSAITLKERLYYTKKTVKQFYLFQNQILSRLLQLNKDKKNNKILLAINTYTWYLILFWGSLAFAVPRVSVRGNYLYSISLKGAIGLLAMHPFLVLLMHGRYYISLIPLFAILVTVGWIEGIKQAFVRPANITFSTKLVLFIQGICLLLFIVSLIFGVSF